MPPSTGVAFIHSTFFTAASIAIHLTKRRGMTGARQHFDTITTTPEALLATFLADSKSVAGADFAVDHGVSSFTKNKKIGRTRV
jgi:hypothetical protein